MRVLEFLLGAVLTAGVLFDVFQAVVVPRPTPRGIRLSPILVRGMWRLWRGFGLGLGNSTRRERFLGTFAPLVVILLLLCWVGGLILGYGLEMYALRSQIQPQPDDLGTALYFAGTSLLTLGFGDLVATGPLARLVALVAAASGLAIVALLITFLFSLFDSFRRREVHVVTLDARAGVPPSGVTLLETYAHSALLDDLPRTFAEWEVWSAEVLESHLSYPILAYFRSTHDNESWVSALGAVLDAATLVLTTIEGGPRGAASMMHSVGRHLVNDLSHYFRLPHEHEINVEPDEFERARERLAAAGFRLRQAEDAWTAFAKLRADYAGPLNALAKYWAAPPTQWIGDRSTIPHLARAAAVAPSS